MGRISEESLRDSCQRHPASYKHTHTKLSVHERSESFFKDLSHISVKCNSNIPFAAGVVFAHLNSTVKREAFLGSFKSNESINLK